MAQNFGNNIKKLPDQRLRRWSEGGHPANTFDFAQPRLIDKQRLNNEFDDSGFGQGEDLNRSNGYVTAHHTHFGENSEDTIQHEIYHQPITQAYLQPQSYQQPLQTEYNFSYPNQSRHIPTQKDLATVSNSFPDHQFRSQEYQGFNVQNPYVSGYHNQVNEVNHSITYRKKKKTYTEREDAEGIQAALAWNNAYSSDSLYTYIVEQERQFHSNHKPIAETQTDISVNDRSTLMTWLIRICTSNHFESMHLEALHLCVGIIDDYLSRKAVEKSKFQLIGVTALLLASKQLIYDPPDINSLVQLCENIYSGGDIKSCEEEMLKVLNWTLHRPTGHTFVDFFAGRLLYQNSRQQEQRIIRHLAVARYCLTIGLLSASFACFSPSIRARAAYICAAQILQEPHLDLPFGEECIMRYSQQGSGTVRYSKKVLKGVEMLKKVMSDQSEYGLEFQPRTIDLYSYP